MQVPPPQSGRPIQAPPEQPAPLEAQPVSLHVWPAGHPRVQHPIGGGSVQPAGLQMFPKQQLGSCTPHQSQQNAPA